MCDKIFSKHHSVGAPARGARRTQPAGGPLRWPVLPTFFSGGRRRSSARALPTCRESRQSRPRTGANPSAALASLRPCSRGPSASSRSPSCASRFLRPALIKCDLDAVDVLRAAFEAREAAKASRRYLAKTHVKEGKQDRDFSKAEREFIKLKRDFRKIPKSERQEKRAQQRAERKALQPWRKGPRCWHYQRWWGDDLTRWLGKEGDGRGGGPSARRQAPLGPRRGGARRPRRRGQHPVRVHRDVPAVLSAVGLALARRRRPRRRRHRRRRPRRAREGAEGGRVGGVMVCAVATYTHKEAAECAGVKIQNSHPRSTARTRSRHRTANTLSHPTLPSLAHSHPHALRGLAHHSDWPPSMTRLWPTM